MSVFGDQIHAGRRQKSGYRAIATKAAALAISVAAGVLPASSASAQGIFDSLFGRRPAPSASAYADPSPSVQPVRLPPGAQRPTEMRVGAVAFCVRTCDGRFFPVQQHAGLTQAQACSSFCPAAQTKIYNGPDGCRYTGRQFPLATSGDCHCLPDGAQKRQ